MKKLTSIILILILSISAFGQHESNKKNDSIQVRLYNKGKHYIKSFIVSINVDDCGYNGDDYEFRDISNKKYSDYITMPYIWSKRNTTKTELIVKQHLKNDTLLFLFRTPINHKGDTKITDGKYTLYLKIKTKKDEVSEFKFNSYLKKE